MASGKDLSKEQIKKLLLEKQKRDKIRSYENDFVGFAEEQIKIITKDASQGFVNFKLNDAQAYVTRKLDKQLAETGRVRAIILKARQQGISTYCSARVFWKSYYSPHSRSVVLAHDGATSDALFTMSKNVIKNMDPEFKPKEQKSNAKEIILQSPAYKDKEAVGSYRLYTAGSPEAGRGTTPTIAHLSEVAFWQHDEKILAGLFQGISEAAGTEVILESTANGARGEFYRLWKGAVAGENDYIPIFLPWFLTKEYRRNCPVDIEFTQEEEDLMKRFRVDEDQIYWRRLKIAESGEMKFRQEYPSTPEEAFITSGSNVFSLEKLDKLLPSAPSSRRTWDLNSKMFEDNKEGKLYIFDYPEWDTNYVIAADVSLGVGQDYSVGIVMNQQYKVIAMYRDNRIDPSLFGEVLFYLGRYYNNALLCVESNSMGVATLQKLSSMDYVNLYKQTKIANVSKDEGLRLGFRTTAATKPAIIGNLKNLIENEEVNIPSNIIIQELKDYISTDTGKTEAAPGSNDDTVIAIAMCCEVLRTHYDRLSSNKVSWSQRTADYTPDSTEWL